MILRGQPLAAAELPEEHQRGGNDAAMDGPTGAQGGEGKNIPQGGTVDQVHPDHEELGAQDGGDEHGNGQVRDGRWCQTVQEPLPLRQGRAREEGDGQQQPVGA